MTSCYFPSGEFSDKLRPCGSDSAPGQHCCFEGHYCLSNMLCMNPENLGTYRGGCTLDKWDNSACGDICMKYPATQSSVWRCSNETDGSGKQLFACEAASCGSSDQMFTIGEAQIQLNAQLSSAIDLKADFTKTVEVTAATTTGGCASTSDASPGAAVEQSNVDVSSQSCDGSGVSTGAAVGIGLGTSIPLLIALAFMTWLFWRERKRKRAISTPAAAHNFGSFNDTSAYHEQERKLPEAARPEAPLPELSQENQTRWELDASGT